MEEQAGLTYALWARLGVLTIIALSVFAALPFQRALPYLAVIAVFALLGLIPHGMRRLGLTWMGWTAAFTLLDVCLLVYLLTTPNPIVPDPWPPQMYLRLGNFMFLLVFLTSMAISYSPALVLWTGGVTLVAWGIGVYQIVDRPETRAYTSSDVIDDPFLTGTDRMNVFLEPYYLNLTEWYNQLMVILVVSLLIAISVWRARRLVKRQITAETARANLTRYFSPNVVDQLASSDNALEQVSTHKAAVLFVDMVGFTSVSEKLSPERVIALLRSFHRRMSKIVFDHGGTIDKYIGDAVMASFGTPRPGPKDATHALQCACAMVTEIERWNGKRAARGADPVEIGVGVHYGEVVAGNIGHDQHLEFTVLGDTVNVASRLERLTRDKKTPVVVSGDLVAAARQEQDNADALLAQFEQDDSTNVRGRDQPVLTWRLNGAAAGTVGAAAALAP